MQAQKTKKQTDNDVKKPQNIFLRTKGA